MYVSRGRLAPPGWLENWARIQWAITIGLVPLLIVLFQQVSIVSPIANAIAIPLVSLVVVPLTLLGLVLPWDLLLVLAAMLMRLCDLALQALSRLPAAVWEQHAPAVWAVPVAMLGMLWLLAPRGFPARWLGLAGFLPLLAIAPQVPRALQVWIDVLDVGQGLAVVVRTANHSLLYDTGPAYSNDADSGSRIVVPFLRAAGIVHLDGVIVSHDDLDHSGGLLSVLQAVPVDWVATSLPQSEPALALSARSQRCFAGQHWQWDGVRFEILHPTWGSYNDATIKDNDRGCVLRVVSAAGAVLLTADIERQSEQQLLQHASLQLPADVLIVPHHGSMTSSSDAFLDQVHPHIAIIPVGYRNRFGHPAADVLARYQRLGARIFRTDRDGALLVRLDDTITVGAWHSERPRYWQGR
jgi:competence protein ComEC